MTSKCGRNKKVAHEARPSVSLILLLNIYRFENVHEFRRQWVNRCPSWQEDDVYKPTGHQYCEKTSTTQIADLIKNLKKNISWRLLQVHPYYKTGITFPHLLFQLIVGKYFVNSPGFNKNATKGEGKTGGQKPGSNLKIKKAKRYPTIFLKNYYQEQDTTSYANK